MSTVLYERRALPALSAVLERRQIRLFPPRLFAFFGVNRV